MKTRISSLLAAVTFATAFSAVECHAASLTEVATSRPELSKFMAAIRDAGLDKDLGGKKQITAFVPTDAALDALPGDLWSKLKDPKNKALLVTALKGHLTPGNYSSQRLVKARAARYSIPSMAKSAIVIDRSKALTANGAALYRLDITGDNGTIHVMDKVFLPTAVKAMLPAPPKPAKPEQQAKPTKAKK